jgi:hypothetical protein
MLASAITVGGVLGVSGAVALKDSTVAVKPGAEISLSEASLKKLRDVQIPIVDTRGGSEQDIRLLREQVGDISRRLTSAGEKQEITGRGTRLRSEAWSTI